MSPRETSARFVFLIGRPCTGKSLAGQILTDELRRRGFKGETAFIHDLPALWRLIQEDRSFRRHRPAEDGGFEITDGSIWEEMDLWLKEKLEAAEADLVIAEAARHTYAPLFDCLTRHVLRQALVLYLSSPWEVAWSRNVERGRIEPARYIARVDMEKWYARDDLAALRARGDISLTIIENNSSRDDLRAALQTMIDSILQNQRDDS